MMEHKAFLFDYDSFDRELRPILEEALAAADASRIRTFIDTHVDALRDPDEGHSIGADWQSHREIHDAHQYGDLALTKYYRPTEDIGLGAAWERVQASIAGSFHVESPILGAAVGPREDPFDPGKLGSYFQSARHVRENYERMVELAGTARSTALNRAIVMLEQAARTCSGLYVTF